MSVIGDATQGFDTGMSCTLFPQDDHRDLTTYATGGITVMTHASENIVIDIPSTFTETANVESGELHCLYGMASQGFTTASSNQTFGGLALRNVEIHLQWVAVHTFP